MDVSVSDSGLVVGAGLNLNKPLYTVYTGRRIAAGVAVTGQLKVCVAGFPVVPRLFRGHGVKYIFISVGRSLA